MLCIVRKQVASNVQSKVLLSGVLLWVYCLCCVVWLWGNSIAFWLIVSNMHNFYAIVGVLNLHSNYPCYQWSAKLHTSGVIGLVTFTATSELIFRTRLKKKKKTRIGRIDANWAVGVYFDCRCFFSQIVLTLQCL